MLDKARLFAALDTLDLEAWQEPLWLLCETRLADGAHGHLAGWKELLGAVAGCDRSNREHLEALLKQLIPWRKGPFDVCGVHIDSDLKWARLEHHVADLVGRRILDVGCGNGYYAMRMRRAGAELVLGIDPTVLCVVQFEALRQLLGIEGVHVLPLRLEDLPPRGRAFDSTFSMGVLYHRRDPLEHLSALHGTLRPGGELVLETLILPGAGDEVLVPPDRYARMRNVWHLPTVAVLEDWLETAGFVAVRVVDVSPTTTAEQRQTEWMPFESLREALDPDDPTLTVEGLPAPQRAILLARA
jgi:tRNA (mo5U34)-methyltransferase